MDSFETIQVCVALGGYSQHKLQLEALPVTELLFDSFTCYIPFCICLIITTAWSACPALSQLLLTSCSF